MTSKLTALLMAGALAASAIVSGGGATAVPTESAAIICDYHASGPRCYHEEGSCASYGMTPGTSYPGDGFYSECQDRSTSGHGLGFRPA